MGKMDVEQDSEKEGFRARSTFRGDSRDLGGQVTRGPRHCDSRTPGEGDAVEGTALPFCAHAAAVQSHSPSNGFLATHCHTLLILLPQSIAPVMRLAELLKVPGTFGR